MSIVLQTIRSHIYEEIPSIYLQINNKKYLFNVPDSFQRFRAENQVKGFKGANIFLTRLRPQYVNGIFGFIQTLFSSELASNGTKIFGPEGTYDLFQQLKKSIIVGYCLTPYSVYEFFSQKCLEGVNKEFIQKMMNKDEQKMFTQEAEKEAKQSDKNSALTNISIVNQNPIFKDENLEIYPLETQYQKQQVSISYLGIPNKIKGEFRKDLADDHKLEGRQIGALRKNGELKLENGEILYLKDFYGEDIASPCFLILDIQNENQIDQIIDKKEVQQFFKENQEVIKKERVLKVVMHMCSDKNVLKSEKYAKFVELFDIQNIDHVFTYSGMIYDQKQQKERFQQQMQVLSRKQAHLNLLGAFNGIFSEVFSKLNYQNIVNQISEKISPNYENEDYFLLQSSDFLQKIDSSNKLVSMNYYSYYLTPIKSQGYRFIQNFNIDDEDKVQISQPTEGEKQKINLKQNSGKKLEEDPEIVFLGTGSMQPSKFRNVSGILINCGERGCYLFDCGEGSYNQILERYGVEKSEEILMNLRGIIITHSHSDHHLGSLHLLNKIEEIFTKKIEKNNSNYKKEVYLCIPGNMAVFMKIYQKYVDKMEGVKLFFAQQLTQNVEKIDLQFLKQEFQSQQFQISEEELLKFYNSAEYNVKQFIEETENSKQIKIQTVPVVHCPQAYGASIELLNKNQNLKVTYSGDTRPCEAFIKMSKDADIMIHEGTFSNDLQANAESHNHSTTKEAVQSAIKANAKNLILTHFSQRFSKTPKFDDDDNSNDDEQNKDQKEEIEYKDYLLNKTILAFDQLGGQVSSFQNFVAPTWYIAKNLNIDQEEEEVEKPNNQKKQKEKKQKNNKKE